MTQLYSIWDLVTDSWITSNVECSWKYDIAWLGYFEPVMGGINLWDSFIQSWLLSHDLILCPWMVTPYDLTSHNCNVCKDNTVEYWEQSLFYLVAIVKGLPSFLIWVFIVYWFLNALLWEYFDEFMGRWMNVLTFYMIAFEVIWFMIRDLYPQVFLTLFNTNSQGYRSNLELSLWFAHINILSSLMKAKYLTVILIMM